MVEEEVLEVGSEEEVEETIPRDTTDIQNNECLNGIDI